MVSIKTNSKGVLQEATGLRARQSSMYSRGQNTPFKISRSKFSDFLDCPRCFYLDRVKGLQSPSMPGWALNSTVDDLLKKEFDQYRSQKKPHPIFIENNLTFIPYHHDDIDHWRNSLKGGISYEDPETNLVLHGGVDDVWFNVNTEELVVADYKAQSSSAPLEVKPYLDSPYHQGYKRQMDIYVHILRKMGFKVANTTYFMVCNGEKTPDRFDAKMEFTIKLIPYESDTSWINPKIREMKETLELKAVPDVNPYCENCAYIHQGNELSKN